MTKLLISVRSAAEARLACDAGADLIDVKEPTRGSLGAPDAATIEQIAREVAGRLPLSVALGELLEAAPLSDTLAGRVRYAKFGLAGCRNLPDWTGRWKAVIARLPKGVTPVAVAYADWESAMAPDPARVSARARRLRCGAVLLDTFDKSRGPLTDQIGRDELREFVALVRACGLVSAVAGSLGPAEIVAVAQLAPDYIAVRGAACAGDRTGHLDRARVRQLAALVRRASGSHRSVNELPTEVSARHAVARFAARRGDQFA